MLQGNAAANSLAGAGGADSIFGGGNDTLIGGGGANTYFVNSTGDRIIDGGTGSIIRSGVSFDLGSSLVSGVNNLTYTGVGSASLRGNSAANSLSAGAGADTLFGGGNDTLIGGGGADLYIVSSTADRIIDAGGSGSTVMSSVSYDLSSSLAGGVNGTIANLVYTSSLGGSLKGNAAANSITGNTGADTLFGSAGADTAADTLQGGAGNDLYVVASIRDTIIDTGGVNTLQSSVSYDLSSSLVSGVNNLTYTGTLGGVLQGNAAANSLAGAGGADTLKAFGGIGGVTQSSGFERDVMTGGGGADTFILADTTGSYYLDSGVQYPGLPSKSDASWCAITDFQVGVDKILLSSSVGWNGYSFAYYGDVKSQLSSRELSEFTNSTGVTPRDNDILLYQGDYQSGPADFMAGIRTTSGQRLTDSQITNSVRWILNNGMVYGVGNDTITGSSVGETLQAYGGIGGVTQSSGFERDVMTGGGGADTFILADTTGSYYLDSGVQYPGLPSKSDASWCAITDFQVGVDKILLSSSVGWNGYSFAYYGDVKSQLSSRELSEFTNSTGVTPRDNDILLYQGDYQSGPADFMAGIRTTSGQRFTDSQIINSVSWI